MSTGRQLPLPFVHTPAYAACDFVAAPSNEEALTWLALAADWPGGRLALWGEAGTGKTHLLHRWAMQAGAALLGPGELGPGAVSDAPPATALAIDDADFAPEEKLLHLLNASAEARLPVLLAGRTPPARWPVRLPDLASRLRATAAIRINPPDDQLLQALLARLISDRQLAVPEPAQAALLARLPRSPAALREAIARLDTLALAAGGRVTRPLAIAVATEIAGTEEDDDDFASHPEAPSRREPALF
jgi:chromosomal replication initiation ATPase DnaA